MKRSLTIALLVIMSALALSLAACQPGTAASVSANKAPDFTLPDLDGKPYTLSANTSGKVVLLDFFATWCPPCRMEVPHLQELYEKYGDEGFVVVGISLDQGGAADVKPFAAQYGVTYPTLIGDQRTASLYGGIRGIPTLFLIDKEGNIFQRYVGYRAKEELEAEIQKLL